MEADISAEQPNEGEKESFQTFVVEASELKELVANLQKNETLRNNDATFNRLAIVVESLHYFFLIFSSKNIKSNLNSSILF